MGKFKLKWKLRRFTEQKRTSFLAPQKLTHYPLCVSKIGDFDTLAFAYRERQILVSKWIYMIFMVDKKTSCFSLKGGV
ncbi:hypothetical protein DPQ22_00005 [Candidatus Tokpelaia sp.]|nr:hypothetical protein DPQ22_00005 [Candidatus Tokpelaia sp.]